MCKKGYNIHENSEFKLLIVYYAYLVNLMFSGLTEMGISLVMVN